MMFMLALTGVVVLKGQELIFGARTKAMLSQTEQIRLC